MSSIDSGSEDCADDKKLWLDYLAKLRDRADRSNQVTGVTNWVLYGIMGTLLYKATGFLPLAFSDLDYRYDTYIFVILGLNFLVLGQQVIREALPRMKGGVSDIRAIPDKLQTLVTSYFGFFAVFVVLLGLVELWLGYQNLHMTRFVRYSFFGFGAFHFILGIAIGEVFYIKRKLDGIKKGMFPQFQGAAVRGEWAMNTFVFLATIVALVSIIFHVRGIIHTSPTWLLSMQSTFGILVFLWATHKLIFLRPAHGQITDAITDLERQALVENLSGLEIKARFKELTSGKRLTEWLEDSSESSTKTWKSIWNYLETVSADLTSVCSLPPSADKLEELRNLKHKIEKDTAEYAKPFAANSVQIGATVAINWALGTASSKDTIDRFKDYKKEADEFDVRLKALFQRLEAEIARTTNELSISKKMVALQ